jgi:hypothetical protein
MTAWLCLAIALLTGVAPAQGFVLCIEADGCVSVEIKATDESCGGCDGHEAGTTTTSIAAAASGDAGCPCIDVAVPGAPQDERLLPRALEFQLGPWVAPTPALLPHALVAVASSVRAAPADDPRPPESLALIRTVVLLE